MVKKVKAKRPKTVKAVVWVAVLPDGEYSAVGWAGKQQKHTEADADNMMSAAVDGLRGAGAYHYVRVEVDIPVPVETVEAKGKVTDVRPGEQ